MRQERNTYYAIGKDVDKNAERPFCLFALDGMKGVHGEGKSVGCALLYKKHHCGDENGDYGGGTGKAVIAARRLGKESIVYLYREGAVALPNQQRRAKIGKGAHEHQQRSSQDGGHAQGQDYFKKAHYALAAHVFRCLQQRVVNVFHSAGDIQKHQRKQLKRQHQQNAVEAVDAGQCDAQQRFDCLADDA